MITENISAGVLDEIIAGLLDGDGHKSQAAIASGQIIGMNDREALELIHLRIGGEIILHYKKGDKSGSGTATKDGYELRHGRGGNDNIPQSIAFNLYEPDARRRWYKGSKRLRDMPPPGIGWFAGFFMAEGFVDVKSNRVQVILKDKIMLEPWLNRYGGNIRYIKPYPQCNNPNSRWQWYNHVRKTAYIINELAPFTTWDKRRKMMELWNHYVGKIQ